MAGRTRLIGTLVLVGLFPAGCGDDDSATDDGGADDAGADADVVADADADADADAEADVDVADDGDDDGGSGLPEMPALTWEPCPLFSDDPEGPTADCATAIVPLDWSSPEGTLLELAVKRVRAEGATDPATQLWMIPGGPGGSAMIFESSARNVIDTDPSIEVFLWDHRGVPESTPFGCREQQRSSSDWGSDISPHELLPCGEALVRQWGAEQLTFFNPNEAARDLASLVDRTRGPDERVFIFGSSYGTVVVLRYLKAAPRQATAVAIEGVVNPITRDWYTMSGLYSDVIAEYVSLCAGDAVCSAKLGPDPKARLDELMAAQAIEGCPIFPAGSSLDFTRGLFLRLREYWQYRPFIAALVYRLLRCTPEDQDAARHLYYVFNPTPSPPTPLWRQTWSLPLLRYIGASEWSPDVLPTVEEQQAFVDTLYVPDDGTVEMLLHAGDWPNYEVTAEDRRIPVPEVPTLIVHGTLDTQCNVGDARLLAEAMATDHTVYAEFVGGKHGILVRSAVEEFETDPTTECAQTLFWGWLADPTRIDTSCLADQPPLGYDADPALVEELFGTTDLWE
jgi:pimeloyl-ACP methyl ester carboxylesterase